MKGQHIVMGGTIGDTISYCICNIDSTLRCISSVPITNDVYGRPFKIKRIKGMDYYVSGCVKHIVILKTVASKIMFIKSYKDVHTDYIYDLCIVRNCIFSKARNESHIKVSYFGDEFAGMKAAKDNSTIQSTKNREPNMIVETPTTITPTPQSKDYSTSVSSLDIPICMHHMIQLAVRRYASHPTTRT